MLKACRKAAILLSVLWIALALAGRGVAQSPPPPSPSTAGAVQLPAMPSLSPGPFMPNFLYISTGPMWESKTVTGAPYSAEAVSESRQVLADGNVIAHKETSMIYRDSAGRVRRETNRIGPLGMWAGGARMVAFNGRMTLRKEVGAEGNMTVTQESGAGPGTEVSAVVPSGGVPVMTRGGAVGKMVTIHDPVDHVTYMLVPARKIAYKMTHPPRVIARFRHFARQVRIEHEWNETSQSLGTRTFDGVTAYGTRTTMVIPAGAIGNEKPIKVISDRWYSPKLEVNVMTRRDDPRFGVVTYKLTNIKLGEPPASLFKVPAGYTVKPFPPKHPGDEFFRYHTGGPPPKNG